MSKSILQSIKPQYCELIASGKKTTEVRKTRPKLQTPFKMYIYMTKSNLVGDRKAYKDRLAGKVIGEYVCDKIIEYETEFHPSDDLFQGIWETFYDEDINDTANFIVTSNDEDNPDDCDLCKKSCLSFNDIKNYVGYGDLKFYGWHISDLQIYDKPKELSEFYHYCGDNPKCKNCPYLYIESNEDIGTYEQCCSNNEGCKPLTHPPQSWCYVEEV